MKTYLERIYTDSFEHFCSTLKQAMLAGEKKFVITANPEIIMMAQKQEDLAEILLNPAHVVVPDGISVVQAMQAYGLHPKERIAGVEVADRLLTFAGEQERSVFLLGAKEEVVSTLAKNLRRKYPKMHISYQNGYTDDKDLVFEGIRKLSPDLVLVGLGVPAQERLIRKHLDQFDKGIFIGVGGSMDILSGKKKRAPKLFLRTNTEWLYRIVREPSRIKRFYQNNIQFMRKIKKDLRSQKK